MRRGLGQAKLVPGQINFQTTRTGRIPSLQPLIEAGLPIAPYIEHGSWMTGEPDIMRYGLDPYRGIMGLGATPRRRRRRNGQLGQLLTEYACDSSAAAASWHARVTQAISAGGKAAVVGGAAAALLGVFTKRPLIAALGGAGLTWAFYATWTSTHVV